MDPPLASTRWTRLFSAWMLLAAATMFLGAYAHTSLPIPLIDQPTIVPATIVESLCGTALLVGAISLLLGRPSGITAAVTGHLVAMGGFVLGMIAPDGDAANTTLNWYYHRVMLAAFVIGFLLLTLPGPRSRFVSRDAAA